MAIQVVPEHELLRPIASGAYGQVWLARNRLGAYRAVKIVHRTNFDHDRPFEREFAGIKAFEPVSRSHEGLVDLLQVGRDDAAGYFYYVMELADDLSSEGKLQGAESFAGKENLGAIEDRSDRHLQLPIRPVSTFQHSNTPALQDFSAYAPRTLAAELRGRARLPLDECIRIGLALTEALGHLHRQGLVHRDVKPSNIIFVRGMPKLADVGLVTGVGEARSFVGTEGFIAPEGPGTPQADIYSLGIVLYVMSTGKSHADFPEPLSDPAALPEHERRLEFDVVIHKACQADPRERYQTAEEMQQELALLQRGGSVKRKRAAQRRWSLAAWMSLTAVALALPVLLRSVLGGTSRHIPDPEAVRLYQRGRWDYSQLTPEAHQKALETLTRATRKDPRFVEPYAELTALYVWSMLPGLTSDAQRLEQTRAIAAKAAAVDANSAEAYAARSWCRFLERDWPGAEAEIVRAIKRNPKLAVARDIYSFYLTILERFEEAHRQAQVAEQLEPPESARVTAIVAAFPYMGERRYDLAISQLQKVADLDPNFSTGRNFLGICYEAQSNYVAAIEQWKASDLFSNKASPEKVSTAYAALRQAYDAQGQEGYYRKWIELVEADNALPFDQRLFYEEDLAGCYAMLGEKEKALDEIEKHFDQPQRWHQIKFEPLYDTLHDEPRFKALVKRAGLQP